MFCIKLQRFVGVFALMIAAGFASLSFAQTSEAGYTPELPSPVCDNINVPQGHTVAFRTYARGVQIYRWDGDAWQFVAPRADLFGIYNFRQKVVGIHHGGPIWESENGSKVLGFRVAGCTPDPTAISWLLLKGASTDTTGIFNGVTYIQRVNTVGGLAPNAPGKFVDQMVEVPYTTDYYFYRAKN
jgi:hypothetical protein